MKKQILTLIAIIGLLIACDRHPNISDIQQMGAINISQYRGYQVISKDGDSFYWYIMKGDTIKGIIVPKWFKTVYNVTDTIK